MGTWEAGALPQRDWGKTFHVIMDIDHNEEGLIISASDKIPLPMAVRWHCASCRTPLQPGRWAVDATLKPLQAYANPGGHDPLAGRMRSGVRAMAILTHPVLIAEKQAGPGLEGWRHGLSEHIRAGRYPMKPLLLGLVLGDKSEMNQDHWRVLRDTGTAHLLAISGLHLTMVATGIYTIIFCVTRLMLIPFPGLPAKSIAWIISCLLSYPYVVLTGNQISAWRAYIMLGCMSLIVLGKRSGLQLKDLAIITVLVILLQPYALASISLWLSVGAIALILLMGYQYAAMPRLHRMLIMQWQMSLGLGVLACMMMHTFSLTSPLANIIAIPYVSIIVVPLCFLATVVYWVYPPAAAYILSAADLSLQPLWWGLQGLSSLSAAPMLWITTPWQWICASTFIALCTVPATKNLRVISLILWVGIVFPIPPHPKLGEAWIDVLDVGQGLAIVVRTQAHVLVYDTGAGFGERAVAEFTLLPFLHHEHIKRIDTLMISHADNDHRGGYAVLKSELPITQTLSGEPRDAVEQPCKAGQAWHWDDVSFSVISPGPKPTQDHNNHSCVLRISVGTHAVLLTGDIESAVERVLVAEGQLKADVLVVPHHGSKTSSTVAFVAQVQPQHAIVSAGLMNRYHHPHPEIVKRYDSQGIKLWNTAQSGAMHVKISRSGAKVWAYKESHT